MSGDIPISGSPFHQSLDLLNFAGQTNVFRMGISTDFKASPDLSYTGGGHAVEAAYSQVIFEPVGVEFAQLGGDHLLFCFIPLCLFHVCL